jgi:hypothetical protein
MVVPTTAVLALDDHKRASHRADRHAAVCGDAVWSAVNRPVCRQHRADQWWQGLPAALCSGAGGSVPGSRWAHVDAAAHRHQRIAALLNNYRA